MLARRLSLAQPIRRGATFSTVDPCWTCRKRLSWFASSRMHEQAPAVQRMLKALPESDEEGGGERVVLFLREAGCYYTYCGEVRAAAWAPGSHPLQLVWELQRFDDLVKKAAFKALLGPAMLPLASRPHMAAKAMLHWGSQTDDGTTGGSCQAALLVLFSFQEGQPGQRPPPPTAAAEEP